MSRLTFGAETRDGPLPLEASHTFGCRGRLWVVHRNPGDLGWTASCAETGYRITSVYDTPEAAEASGRKVLDGKTDADIEGAYRSLGVTP